MPAQSSEDTPRIDAILDAIRALGGEASPKEIVAHTGMARENVQGGLTLARDAGLVVKPKYGRYRLSGFTVAENQVKERPEEYRKLPTGRAGLPLHSVIPLISIEVGGKMHTQAELVIRTTGEEARVKVGG